MAGKKVGTRSGIPSIYCVCDDHYFLASSIISFKSAGPVTVFVSKTRWNGDQGAWESCVGEAEAAGAEVIVGDWPDESLHRRAALEAMKKRGCSYVFIPDSDEIVDPFLLESLIKIAKSEVADLVRVKMDTFWRSPRYVIRPREELAPILLLDCRTSEHLHIREYSGSRAIVLGPEFGVLNHLSYAGPDERIQAKITSWGHRAEVVGEWFQRKWLCWAEDQLLRDLHPTHPQCYGFVERTEIKDVLANVRDDWPVHGEPKLPKRWPTVSIVIPLHGAEAEVRNCLASLEACKDLIHETIVVDDASPDNAAETAASFAGVTLLSNEENLGFGATCNRGYEASTGEVVLFLNSDTAVPRAGFIRLIECLISSGTVGAAGPFTNNCGYHQYLQPTYTEMDCLDLFANDFAFRKGRDQEVNMLVGFCLAVRRSVLEEVGAFDDAFGIGMFEDNDLCYRILRAGYKLKVANRAYVHHEGSRSLIQRNEHPTKLLGRNREIFYKKWHQEIESGFASHLSGAKPEAITFNQDLHPDRLMERIEGQAKTANISLCMIVKNEERVIRDCLASAKPFFSQIVVVDTGSTDRTVEIAEEMGAEVHHFPWTDSFSEARNESLKYAKGKWIFWMDADDTLPPHCGEHLLHIATYARDEIVGFVVPVQFVEAGPGGTRVDHVKLFRKKPEVKFEFRIHEQNLTSLRAVGGEIARSEAYVLHSGYDTSTDGQARKRERDYKLLALDLEEQGEHPFILFNLGMTDHFTERHERAIDWLQRSIAASSEGESHLRKAYALLTGSQKALGMLEDALDTALEGLVKVGEDPELRFLAGIVLTDLGRYEEAKAQYLGMCPEIESYFSSIDVSILGSKRDHNLGVVCHYLGSYPEAKIWWLRAVDANPPFTPSLETLWASAQDALDYATQRKLIERIHEVYGKNELWANYFVAYHNAVSGPGEGEAILAQALQREPQASAARMVLARLLLAQSRPIEAHPHLMLLEQNGVAEAAYFLSVLYSQLGDFRQALLHMEEAHRLNPSHDETRQQVENLRRAVAS